jgi:hypothetical protein
MLGSVADPDDFLLDPVPDPDPDLNKLMANFFSKNFLDENMHGPKS